MAEKIVIDLDVNTSKGVQQVNKLNKSVSNTNKEISTVSDSSKKLTSSLDSVSGGAVSAFKNLKSGLTTAVSGFNSLKVAIIGTGIGALIIAILAVKQAFTSSEEGQNKFAKLMGVIGALTGNLVDLLADLGEKIISVFENPKQALIDFKNLIVTNIQNRFKAILDTVGFLGSAFKKVFSGDFSGALDDAKKAGSSFVDTLTGVEDTLGKVTKATSNFVAEQKKELKQAAAVADMRAKADKIERKLIVERSKLESEIANLRLKSRQEEEFSAEERKKALLDAQALEEKLLNQETEYLKLRRDAQILENTFSRSNKENLNKEAEAIAAVNRQQAARANTARQVQREVNTISKQIEAENKRIADEAKARKKEEDDAKVAKEKELADLKNQIRDAEAVTEDERKALEIEKTTEHYNKLIELAKAQGLTTVALEGAKTKALNKLNQTNSKNEIHWEKLTQQEKERVVSQGLNNLTSILGEESAAGKAAAIASATISTYQSATDSYKSLAGIPIIGPALGFAAAGAAVTAGFANVKKIVSTKVPNSGGSGGSAPSISGSTASATSIPPAFNVVGASNTNQLADAIGGQAQQPVKAYVVSNDVTTAQSMDRNIVNGASI
jgi:hypothetical protein